MLNFNVNDSLGYYFIKSYVLYREVLNNKLKENGITINSDHWTVLVVIYNNPGVSQTVISKYSFRDKSSITRMLDYLEKVKLIRRKNDKTDRRSFNIFLTQEGESLYEKVLNMVQELDNFMYADIDLKDIEKFKKVFRTIIGQFK